jgi:tetratricopeptide (TPR) repeat protein
VLIDMGIARQLNTGDGDWHGQTMGPVGTPAYMSPEQLEASPDVDVTTDVYGLGAVLFELLCGQPARGLGDLCTWDRALIERRLAEPARPPSEVVGAECFGTEHASRRARQMRGDLDAIVVKALEHDPTDRYPSVEAFSADLQRWLDHRPVVAHPISSWGRLWRLARRKPGATLAVAAAALVLSITSIVTSVSLVSERRARAMLAEQLETTDRIRRFVQDDVFERAIPELDGPQKPVIELVRGVAQTLGTRLDDAPAVALGLRSVLLAVLAKMGDLDGAEAQADAGWPLARSLPEDHPQRLEFEIEAARLLEYRYLHVEAEQALHGLIPRLERARGPAADMRADVLGDLGVALLGQNKLDQARARFHEALELAPNGDPRRYLILANLVQVEGQLNGPAAEVAPTRQLLDELEQRFGPDHVWVMSVASNLCDTLLDLGQPQAALPFGQRALAIAESKFDQDHESRFTILNNIAGCLSKTGRFEEALPLRREVLEGRRALLGDQNLAVGIAALNLATTLHLSGRTSEALEPGELAAEITRTVAGLDHPDTARAYHTLAVILGELGERRRSIEAYDTALEIFARAAGDHEAQIAGLRREREAAEAGQ